MSNDGSITIFLRALKDGVEHEAAQRIFERYFGQLERVARDKLAGMRLHDRDEQDVAIVAMEQFFMNVRKGRFPRLNDRSDLWQVLLMILDRRVIDLRRKKPEPVCGESVLCGGGDSSTLENQLIVPDVQPTPDTMVQILEEFRIRLNQLPEKLRPIALWKFEGRTNAEIAQLLSRSEKRVEVKLKLIREIWLHAGGVKR